jgi:hypothetical protein
MHIYMCAWCSTSREPFGEMGEGRGPSPAYQGLRLLQEKSKLAGLPVGIVWDGDVLCPGGLHMPQALVHIGCSCVKQVVIGHVPQALATIG